MASTAHVHRLIVVLPQAAYAGVFSWWAANVDPSDNGSAWPTLNASGLMSDPETHRWANVALNEQKGRQIIARVCQLAGVTPPTLAQWNGWTKQQKYAWLSATRNALYAATGIWLDLADNETAWDIPTAVLGPLNLKVRHEAPSP